MGGDGGCIPGRADMVRTAGYKFARNLGGMGYRPNSQVKVSDEHLGRNEEKRLRWQTCAATQEALQLPVATDRMGQLYSYTAVLEQLKNRKLKPLPQHLEHLRGRKDVTVLRCGSEEVEGKLRLLCCLQGTPLEDGKAIAMRPCGCAMALSAFYSVRKGLRGVLPEMHSVHAQLVDPEPLEKLCCPACETALRSVETDVIALVPDMEKLTVLRKKSSIRKKRAHTETKPEDQHEQIETLLLSEKRFRKAICDAVRV